MEWMSDLLSETTFVEAVWAEECHDPLTSREGTAVAQNRRDRGQ